MLGLVRTGLSICCTPAHAIFIQKMSCLSIKWHQCDFEGHPHLLSPMFTTPHIKASSHATYIMLHSLGVLQLPRCGITSNGVWYSFPMECGAASHWNADAPVICSHPQCTITCSCYILSPTMHYHVQVTGCISKV